MDATHFDRLAKHLAKRRPADQEPPAAPPAPGAAFDPSKKVPFIFVQTFHEGSVAPKAGADGTFTLVLDRGSGQTLYFSDRPDRIVGAAPTPEFLAGFDFSPDDPPNAALVVDDGQGGTNIAVVELTNPRADPAGTGVTYDAQVLADWEQNLDLGISEAPTDLSALPASFGPAHLVIDDCPDKDIECWWYRYARCSPASCIHGRDYYKVATISPHAGTCYNFPDCDPCEPYGHNRPYRDAPNEYWDKKCRETYPDPCQSGWCYALW
jgi:hypothetical protein